MRHIAIILAGLALAVGGSPALKAQQAAAAGPQTVIGGSVVANDATISGSVMSPGGAVLPNMTVQARDLLTAQIGGTTTSSSSGQFTIAGLDPSSYIIEVVDQGGQIIGTSGFVMAPAGAAITAATVMATTGAFGAALTTAATGVVATLGATAARTMTFAAAAAGVAGVVAPPEVVVASPSR